MIESSTWSLSSPHMGGSEQKFIKEAFDSNWVAPLGPNVSGFENDLESYIGENKAIAALSSGTAAIHLGLVLLGVKAGDEVICQSFTFFSIATRFYTKEHIPFLWIVKEKPEYVSHCFRRSNRRSNLQRETSEGDYSSASLWNAI